MRCSFPAALVIGMLIALCLTAACTMPFQSQNTTVQQEPKTAINVGSAKVSAPGDTLRTGLNDILQELDNWDAESVVKKDYRNSIYYIHAENLDDSGNAARWIFGTQPLNQTTLLVYEGSRWTEIPVTRQFSDKRIDFNATVLPPALFSQNRDQIAGVSGSSVRKDLDLAEGIYTLTIISPGGEQELKFDATTGAMIPLQ